MADFNHHLKKNKILVFFTIFAFLYMSCFTSCSKPKNQEKIETAQKNMRAEKGINSEVPKGERAGNLETAESDNSSQSDKSEEPCGCPPGVDASAENAGQKKPLTQEEIAQRTAEIDRYFQAIEEMAKELPRDTFDPQAVVDKVGKDPEDLFKWVRDNTRLVPYRGFLRGPRGVLMDGIGNSLDRALLLHELLRLQGFQVRLARCELSEEKAKEILEKGRTIPPEYWSSSAEFSSRDVDNLIEKYSSKFEIDPTRFGSYISRVNQEQERFSKELIKRVPEQTNFITEAMKKYRNKGKADYVQSEISELREHWWVQMRKDDAWFDLDPTSKDINFGSSFSPAEDVCQPNELDQRLIHSVDLRVIVEQWKNGIAEEKTVLTHRLIPAELFEKRIVLSHVALNQQKDKDLLVDEDPIGRLKSAVLEEREWQPVLTIGSERITQSSFLDSGDINKNPGKKGRPSGAGGIAGGLFRALAGEETEEDSKQVSTLSAEWIEYTILEPGGVPKKIRRDVFDLIGPANRKKTVIPAPEINDSARIERGLSLLGETEVLIQASRLSPEFVLHLMSRSLLSDHQILDDILKSLNSKENPAALLSKLMKLTPLPGPEYILSGARLSWSELDNKIYLTQPNIINFFRRPLLDQNEKMILKSGFDIVFNEISIDSLTEQDPFQAKIYQGVLDTNAEALIMRFIGGKIENVAEIFALAKEQQIDWVTLSDASSQAWQELNTTEDNRARIELALRNGYLVIAPKNEIKLGEKAVFGWWRIDPNSGSVIGSGPEGGQASAEYAIIFSHVVSISLCIAEALEAKSEAAFTCRALTCLAMISFAVFTHIGWMKAMKELFHPAWIYSVKVPPWVLQPVLVAPGLRGINIFLFWMTMGWLTDALGHLCALLE